MDARRKRAKGTGVFDMESGAFQAVLDESVLYRDLVFRTFIYELNAIGINEYQIIPGFDKLLAAVNGLANQGIARIPVASNITKRFIPTVRITPPTMRKIHFIENGLPLLFDGIKYDRVQFTSAATASEQSDDITLLDDIKHHIEQIKAIVYKTSSGIKSDKVNLGTVKWTAQQKTTSETMYNVAIQDYDVGSYDYQSGDGVAYAVNLAVRDIKRTEYPA